MMNVGMQMLLEDVRALAGKLGGNADRYAWSFYERTVDELTQQEMGQLKVELTELLSQGETAMTETATGAVRQTAPTTEEASSNFFYTYGGKEGREVFNVQMTVRGAMTDQQIEAHVTSTIKAMAAIVRHGGHAKPVGQQAKESAPEASNGHSKGPEFFVGNKGRRMVKFPQGLAEPNEIECPTHSGARMKRRTNENGAWYSHRDGDGYCSASVSV